MTTGTTAVLLALATACATPQAQRPARLDPSNPEAAEAQPIPPPSALQNEAPAPAEKAKDSMEGMSMPSAAATPAKAVYTCPMHADVIRDAPGKCPKCGMTLVPKKSDP